MMTMLDADTKRGEIFTKYMNKIDDAGDIVDGAKDKVSEYWYNYEQELRSKMEVIKSKINGDYDYNEDLRALDPQMEELFNRVNRQFLNLYNNRDDILAEPEEVPEFDPFKDELKPNLGAEDGDEVALFGKKPPNPNEKQGRGTHMNIINYYNSGGSMGEKPEGWTEQDVQNYIDKFVSSKPKDTNLGSVASYVGGDATAAATAAAFNKDKKNKNNKGGSTMVAHYQPRGKSLFEKLKSKPFFNPKDIKPTFPENDPPQLDPKTGMHPNYGKQAGRYKKLDPISADSMPPTGDPETDAVVNKQKTKRTFSKIKKFARGT